MKTFKANIEGIEKELVVKIPQYDELEQSDRIYASKIGELIKQKGKNKILVRSELQKFLKDEGIWTEEQEKQVADFQEKIDKLFKKLRKGGIKLSQGREISIKIMDYRKEIVNIMRKRNIFEDCTCESIAENEKSDFLIYLCTVFPDSGLTYWASFEEMKNDKRNEIYQKASEAASNVFYGLDVDFEKTLPENKWLLKYGFVDENLNYTDPKTKEKVDKNGNPIKKIQEEIVEKYENLQGSIVSEKPFIDDETGEPVIDFKETENKEVKDAKELNESLILVE